MMLTVECIKNETHQVMVAHTFDPSTWEAEAGQSLSSRPTWFTEFRDSQGYTEKP